MDDLVSILSLDRLLDQYSHDLFSLSFLLRWPLLFITLGVFFGCAVAVKYARNRVRRLVWILRAERAFQVAGCLALGPPFLCIGYGIRALRRDQFFAAFYFLVLAVFLAERDRVLAWWAQFWAPAPISWAAWLFP